MILKPSTCAMLTTLKRLLTQSDWGYANYSQEISVRIRAKPTQKFRRLSMELTMYAYDRNPSSEPAIQSLDICHSHEMACWPSVCGAAKERRHAAKKVHSVSHPVFPSQKAYSSLLESWRPPSTRFGLDGSRSFNGDRDAA